MTLECESNAVPPPTITWYKNGRVVTESANLRILAEGQMLEIRGSEVRHEWTSCSLLLVFYLYLSFYLFSASHDSSLLQVSDTGQYVCKATNVAGQMDKNFHLNIYGSAC